MAAVPITLGVSVIFHPHRKASKVATSICLIGPSRALINEEEEACCTLFLVTNDCQHRTGMCPPGIQTSRGGMIGPMLAGQNDVC
ncbi:hypothetical protein CI102_147 [Trichoderma harzianum]|nr:hypothetical protein CI102_147 [Trichoderma harzianum]